MPETSRTKQKDYAALLSQIALGNRPAFDELYHAISPHLFGVLLRMLKDVGKAEEALQEVFVKVWQKAASYQTDKASAYTWLMAIARHHALDDLRRQTPDTEDIEQVPEPATSLSALQEEVELLGLGEALQDCFMELSAESRLCIVSAYCEGYTHSELSTKVNKPLGTIKSWIKRGLAELKRCLEGLL
jgi:RNA polymerase sigma-70 factor (ECF subfamily)